MTLIDIPPEKLPPSAEFLNHICPGISSLDYNVHYSLAKIKVDDLVVDWPFGIGKRATLQNVYLNVARPPLNVRSNESNTYVSLPFHIHHVFNEIITHKDKQQLGEMHIGANFNSLIQDPFKIVQMNPGSLSSMIDMHRCDKRTSSSSESANRNPFAKLTTNFNKILKITSGSSGTLGSFHSIFINNSKQLNNSKCNFVEKVLDFNPETYGNGLQQASKLLVAVHVNVLNIFQIDSTSSYTQTREVMSDRPIVTFDESTTSSNSSSSGQHNEEYRKVIEVPLLRLQLRQTSIVTSLETFVCSSGDPFVAMGLDTGEVTVINLASLTFQTFDELSVNELKDGSSIASTGLSFNIGSVSVTAIHVIKDPRYEWLLVCGYANGEVAILNPFSPLNDEKNRSKYVKKIVAKDSFITYFKKFDLSPCARHFSEDTKEYPTYLVGHFKISHRPISSITSTIPYGGIERSSQPSPMIVAFASQDGFVKFIDLMATYDFEYGDSEKPSNKSIVTDIISNYFNDGIEDISFSSDYRFLSVAGKGDLIEVFKMTYYNVSALLMNKSGTHQQSGASNSGHTRRSFTETIYSNTSNGQFSSHSPFGNVYKTDLSNDITYGKVFPVVIKDIKIVGFFKGHTNTVHKVKFVDDESTSYSANMLYKLMSSGYDGKIHVWEFDYKALPKVRVHIPNNRRRSQFQSHAKRTSIGVGTNTLSPTRKPINASNKPVSLHVRARSISIGNDDLGANIPALSNPTLVNNGSMTMNTILNSMNSDKAHQNNEESEEIRTVNAVYKSLYDLRIRKQFAKTGKKFDAIIHPIVNGKFIPSIGIPLLSLDLSPVVRDGKIDNFYYDGLTLWSFAKSGDIFKYCID